MAVTAAQVADPLRRLGMASSVCLVSAACTLVICGWYEPIMVWEGTGGSQADTGFPTHIRLALWPSGFLWIRDRIHLSEAARCLLLLCCAHSLHPHHSGLLRLNGVRLHLPPCAAGVGRVRYFPGTKMCYNPF